MRRGLDRRGGRARWRIETLAGAPKMGTHHILRHDVGLDVVVISWLDYWGLGP